MLRSAHSASKSIGTVTMRSRRLTRCRPRATAAMNTQIHSASAIPHRDRKSGDCHSITCDRISLRDSSSIGNRTSDTPYGLMNDTRNPMTAPVAIDALAPEPRRRAVDPPADEVQPQVREPERERAVDVDPEPHQHRDHDHRVTAHERVRHLDDPQEHEEEEQAEHERPLRPEREHAQERDAALIAERRAACSGTAAARAGRRAHRPPRRRGRRTRGCRTRRTCGSRPP